jgi:meiotically up-regulated gene 157 (Mug157) protein
LGDALASIGIPHDSVIQYETALKANKFIVIVHGTLDEVEKAKNVSVQNKAETTQVYKEEVRKHAEPA